MKFTPDPRPLPLGQSIRVTGMRYEVINIETNAVISFGLAEPDPDPSNAPVVCPKCGQPVILYGQRWLNGACSNAVCASVKCSWRGAIQLILLNRRGS